MLDIRIANVAWNVINSLTTVAHSVDNPNALPNFVGRPVCTMHIAHPHFVPSVGHLRSYPTSSGKKTVSNLSIWFYSYINLCCKHFSSSSSSILLVLVVQGFSKGEYLRRYWSASPICRTAQLVQHSWFFNHLICPIAQLFQQLSLFRSPAIFQQSSLFNSSTCQQLSWFNYTHCSTG